MSDTTADVEVSWESVEVAVAEGDNGQVMQGQLCLVLEDRASGLQRPANFRLSSVTGTAGS